MSTTTERMRPSHRIIVGARTNHEPLPDRWFNRPHSRRRTDMFLRDLILDCLGMLGLMAVCAGLVLFVYAYLGKP